MNVNIKVITLVLAGFSSFAFSQIKEEKLILNRKRVPEVKKTEKKKTSVETIKNYPPEEKSANPVVYDITDVPSVSDFKTSTIQGSDISPKLATATQDNFARFGFGNYTQMLADANFSTKLDEKVQVGGDAHFWSTKGLKKEYPWSSQASNATVGAFMNYFADKGKLNLTASFDLNDYNYYGIYALQPSANIDLKQKTNAVNLNAFYDHYSNSVVDFVRVKSTFLSDYYDAKENKFGADANLSKHGIELLMDEINMNADLGLGIESLRSDFSILDMNSSTYLNASIVPKITILKDKSYLRIGSNFSFLNGTIKSNSVAGSLESNKTYWFPDAEALYYASKEIQLYAGIEGGLKLNSYNEMLAENPYLVSDQMLVPTETKYHFYFGVKGDLVQNVKYDVSAGFAKVKNIVFYRANDLFDYNNTLNRSAYNFANTFSATYDSGNVSNVTANLEYVPQDNLSVQAELQFSHYDLDQMDQIFNRPILMGNLGAKYNVLDKKLNVGAKVFFNGSRKTNSYKIAEAFGDPTQFSSIESTQETLPGFVDLNINAEYKIHKNFSIFALGNNLLNTKYEVYKVYKVLGAQILGGVKITF